MDEKSPAHLISNLQHSSGIHRAEIHALKLQSPCIYASAAREIATSVPVPVPVPVSLFLSLFITSQPAVFEVVLSLASSDESILSQRLSNPCRVGGQKGIDVPLFSFGEEVCIFPHRFPALTLKPGLLLGQRDQRQAL